MAKITIAELDINVQALITSTSEVKKRIDELKKQQAELTKSGETSSKTFVENAAALNALSAEYSSGVKAITQTTKAINDQASRQELLTMAINSEITSIDEAREANKLLNQLRNSATTATEEGRKEILALNEALDRNNSFIKENADAFTQQKINVGNYTDSIKEAAANINPLNGGLLGFAQRSKEAGGAGALLKTSLLGATNGLLGLAKAGVAFIATPIGAVIAALVLAFALIKNAFDRGGESANKLTRIFSVFGGIINKVLKFLEPLGEFLIDGIVAGFELAGQAADKALGLISDGLAFLGFDKASKSVNEFKENVKQTAREAIALSDAEKELEKQQRKSQLTQLEYQKNSEKLRQIRDNENLTIQERIKANEDLGDVLKAQLRDELAIAQLALKVANLRIEAEGKNKDTLDAQAEALTQIADIQERVTGQESEQLTNRVALQKEAAEKQKEINDKAIERAKAATEAAISESKTQLELFISQQGIRAKSLQEEIILAEQIRDRKIAILKQEFEAGKLTRSEFQLQQLNEQQTFLKTQADVAASFADQELRTFIANNISKIESNKFVTDELLAQEIARLNTITELEAAAQTTRLEKGIINQQQYNEAIKAIDLKFEEDKKVLNDAKIAADLEKNAIDLENRIATDQFNLDLQIQQLEAQRQAEIAAAKKTGTDVGLINQKFAKAEIDLRKATDDAKLASLAGSLGQAAGIFKENTLANKAFSIAEATINTYLGATKALATLPPPFGAIQAGVTIATGLANVAKIGGVKFEKGGIQEIGGKRHSAGGTKFYGEDGTTFEAEAGEGIGVLNRGAFSAFMDFNNRFTSGGKSSPNFMAGGGIITQGVSNNVAGSNLNDILVALQSMPAPIVTVEDISAKTNEVVRVESGANF